MTSAPRLALALLSLVLTCHASAAEPPLIPRRVLFGNPERQSVLISPDGRHLSYLAPVEGVMNVWVAPVDDLRSARPITNDRKRGIRQYFWAYTSRHVLYAQDRGGDENWNIYCADVSAEKPQDARNLTPNPAVQAQISKVSDRLPDEILVGLNDRDAKYHDIHRINVRTGEDKLVLKNPGEINDEPVDFVVADDDYRVRFAFTTTKDAGYHVHVPTDGGAEPGWQQVTEIDMEDALSTMPQGFDKTGHLLYCTDSRGRDTAALVAIDTGDGNKFDVAEDDKADATDVLLHPTEKNVQAVLFEYERPQWKVVDPAIRGDFDYLKTVAEGDFTATSRTLDDKAWVVSYLSDAGPIRYYLYDRANKKARFLFSHRPALEKLPLARMHPVVIDSRDGLKLVSYLTLPQGDWQQGRPAGDTSPPKPPKPLPMVLFVHGGPWARDQWGLNSTHQWLANRGYAVLSVNYRGSTGFGKSFVNASNRQWGGKMHDDLIDAVKWAVDNGYADKDRVAIMGGSYGGYATLVGMTFTPDAFACGVDIVGPSNLTTFLATIPPYWESGRSLWRTRMGDESTPEGLKFLESRSPLSFVDRIKKPLLIGHGKNDPRVKESESAQIVKTMQDKKLPVTYVYYADEGHGFGRPQNRLSFNAVAEQFLAQHLGGRAEPVGNDFEGSTIEIKAGAENVNGLAQAVKGR
jgi:dipeptidyl aminopeptidase/acylaminoacyl peptidase